MDRANFSPEKETAVITGMGILSPYGVGREVFWRGVSAGEVALRPVTRFDASPYRNVLGGEVPNFAVAESATAKRSRAEALVLAALREALADAQLGSHEANNNPPNATPPPPRIGIVLGTNFSGMGRAEAVFRTGGIEEEPVGKQDLHGYLGGDILRACREVVGGQGPEALLSLSCASGTAAIGTGLEWIRAGRCEIVLAGGFDELSESAFAGLSALRAISRETIRPFDRERSGTIFSEGAGVLVLESARYAAAASSPSRHSKPYARLLGRGINNDAFHMTAPEKTGKGIMAVMRMALADADLSPTAIVHLNCHGTGTKYNDYIETLAIKGVYQEHAANLVLTANKSLFGHAMGAAGALEAAVTCLSIKHGLIPPTLNCRECDPELDLDYCLDTPREMPVPFAMTNSYGLGGTNASLIFASTLS